MILAVFAASLLTAVLVTLLLIPRLHRAGITGKDRNKPRRNTPGMHDSTPVKYVAESDCTGQAGLETMQGRPDGVDNAEDIPRGGAVYPEVAEMGGLAIVAGTGVGISVALAMMRFFHVLEDASVILLLAALAAILLTALIGIIDDLLGMRQ